MYTYRCFKTSKSAVTVILIAVALVTWGVLGLMGNTLICPPLAQANEFSWDLADKKATLRDWEIISGDWKFKDGWWDVRSTSAKPGIALIKESVARKFGFFTHHGMVCEVTFEAFKSPDFNVQWENQFIIFAYAPDTDKDHVYQAGQRVGNGQWSIERMDIAVPGRATFQEEFRVLDGGTQGSDVVAPNKQYNFRLEVKDDTIITYSNNRKQMQFAFGKEGAFKVQLNNVNKMPVGRIGISNDNAHTRFKSFRISGPGVRPVEPGGKLITTWARIRRHEM